MWPSRVRPAFEAKLLVSVMHHCIDTRSSQLAERRESLSIGRLGVPCGRGRGRGRGRFITRPFEKKWKQFPQTWERWCCLSLAVGQSGCQAVTTLYLTVSCEVIHLGTVTLQVALIYWPIIAPESGGAGDVCSVTETEPTSRLLAGPLPCDRLD